MGHSNNFKTGDHLDAVRAALAGRVADCWARLEDVVDELHDLHEVEMASIIDHLDTLHPDRTEAPAADSPLG
jgi:hypothetical protein